MSRAHNFSAGPAVLPLSVIEQLADALPNFKGSGLGLMELSHRSPLFDAVHRGAEERLRRVMGIPDEYSVLFLQGGASLQFHMTALNLLESGESADFVVTGTWSNKAVNEAKRVAGGRIAWDGKDANYSTLPESRQGRLRSLTKPSQPMLPMVPQPKNIHVLKILSMVFLETATLVV